MSWHLYAHLYSADFQYHELRIADADGHEIQYDARAVPPSLATPIKRFAERLPDLTDTDQKAFSRFLLENASTYRRKIEEGKPALLDWIPFPRHQWGFRWSESTLGELSSFEEIRVYLIQAELSDDGRHLLNETETLMGRYR